MTADLFAPWPPSATEATLRAQIAAVEALIHAAEAKDGRVTAASLRVALGLGKRVRG